MTHDEVVERALGVEHQRPQLARPVALDLGWLVAESREPQRVGETLGRVDGDDHCPPATTRRFHADHGRCRRLADTAGPRADDDAAPVDDRRERGHLSAPASTPTSTGPRSASNTNGRWNC